MKLNLEKFNKKNICLTGLMGSGKSVTGRLLAKKLGFKFYDTDNLIEKKVNKSIKQIFNDHGEQYFRKIEENVVVPLLEKKKCVISLGGGSVLSAKIRKVLKSNSYTIYLNVEIENLYERLKHSRRRPLLEGENIKKKLIQLTKDRKKYYKEANLILNNSDELIETVNIIIKKLKNNE